MAEHSYVTDTDLSERFPIYTRANVGEVFPDPVTPLTSDTGLWLAELGWRDAWVRMGAFTADEFPADRFCQLGVVGGYCYLNASLIRLFGERAPGLSWQDMDEQFFGAQPGIPPYAAQPGDDRPERSERIGATFAWALNQHSLADLTELTEDRMRTISLRAGRPDLTSLSDEELWQRYCELLPEHRLLFGRHLFATYLASVPVGIISGVAAAVGRADLVMPILAGIGDVDSAAPSLAMWDLGRLVARSAELTAAFDAGVAGLLERLRSSATPDAMRFEEAFAAFVVEFGSRGPNEWEVRSPTWETHPELALSAIDRMRLAPDHASPAEQNAVRAAQRTAAAEELLDLVAGDPDTHGRLTLAIAATRAWLPARERTKTNNIRLIHEMRMPMRELGRRMVERGAFDEIEDFGFVRQAEMPTLLRDPHRYTEGIRQRRADYERLARSVPPFVFVGAPEPPATWPQRDEVLVEVLSTGASMAGVPGCPGVAQGRARIVLDPGDPTRLEPGDVLVAPITDPSWTPLFVAAAGVVVDVGAPLSHAVIVSRELGIPCVVSATNATRRIPDGALVRVDGNTGQVTVVAEP